MMATARDIAHRNESKVGAKHICAGAYEMTGGDLQPAKAHTSRCNELASEIYEALLRVKYMRAVK